MKRITPMSATLKAQAVKQYREEGLSAESIGRKLGVTGRSVRQWAAKAAIKRKESAKTEPVTEPKADPLFHSKEEADFQQSIGDVDALTSVTALIRERDQLRQKLAEISKVLNGSKPVEC